jgi:hypothetical protein
MREFVYKEYANSRLFDVCFGDLFEPIESWDGLAIFELELAEVAKKKGGVVCCTGQSARPSYRASWVRRHAGSRSCPLEDQRTVERALQSLEQSKTFVQRKRASGNYSARFPLFFFFRFRFHGVNRQPVFDNFSEERNRNRFFLGKANRAFVRIEVLQFLLEFLGRRSAHGKKRIVILEGSERDERAVQAKTRHGVGDAFLGFGHDGVN